MAREGDAGGGEREETVKARGGEARDRDTGGARVVLALSRGFWWWWWGRGSFQGPRRLPAGGARGIAPGRRSTWPVAAQVPEWGR